MSGIDQAHTLPETQDAVLQVPQTSSEALERAKKDKLGLIAEIDHPQLKKLAETELAELNTLESQKSGDTTAILDAHREFATDIKALDTIEEKFNSLDNYSEFTNFLTNQNLSPTELENLYDFLASNARKAKREFRKSGLPLNRESYTLFADKFGIPTSTQKNEKHKISDEKNKQSYLNKLPALQSIEWVPETEKLTSMLLELKNLEGTEAQNLMQEISRYLVWENWKGGEIDNILAALKKKDAENTADGKPTKYFETFTRTVRDFSPDVAKRIDIFVANYETETLGDGKPDSLLQRAIVQGGLPDTANVEMNDKGEFVANLPDGTDVIVEVDGNHITRSIHLEGANIPVQTGIERADFSKAQWEYETIRQDLAPKQKRTEWALSFLENPKYADVPLEDMQEGLHKILGYTLYGNLGISSMTDKQQLIQTLKTNVGQYAQKLKTAKGTFEKILKNAIAKNRERYLENDEKIKTTLKAIKNSGLGLWDVEYLVNHIKAGFITPDIGVPIDRQNFDLAAQNFWEPASQTHNPTKHIEYIYRMANKVLTGNPDGKVNEKLVGYSLEQAILNPTVAQKTDAEMKQLLAASGVWSETMGIDKAKMQRKLEKPLN